MDPSNTDLPDHDNPDGNEMYVLRKTHKPLVEKKRRERINSSLSALKSLLLDIIRTNGGVQTYKLDKADVLEMTVSYLQSLNYQQSIVSLATNSLYIDGYRTCVDSMTDFLYRNHASYYTAKSEYTNDTGNLVSSSDVTNIGAEHQFQASLSQRPLMTSTPLHSFYGHTEETSNIEHKTRGNPASTAYRCKCENNTSRESGDVEHSEDTGCRGDKHICDATEGDTTIWRPW